MQPEVLDINGVRITSSAEYIRYLDLTESVSTGTSGTRSPDEVQKIIKSKLPVKTTTSNMTALIIGINDYAIPSIDDLKGAVADAQAIQDYLERHLGVPTSRIRLLLNEKATRDNIIDALIAMQRELEDINHGDAILIYYAGHGQEVDVPKEWDMQGKVQSIVPHDFNGNDIDVIPDYTLGFLIYEISKVHGDNITVIFDCCHSGSGTRKDDEDHLVRSAYLGDYCIPADLDASLRFRSGETGQSINSLFNPSLSTHVLLAACSATERARESAGRGRFTSSLEAALKSVSPDQITYVELMGRLKNIAGQNPQLEGHNRHRVVFNSKASMSTHYPYEIRPTGTKSAYIINAGAADGISRGAEFTVYATYADIFKTPLGIVVAGGIEPFRTTVQPAASSLLEFPPEGFAYAVQTRAGEEAALKVYVALTGEMESVFSAQLLQQKNPEANQYTITPVQDPSVADLELRRDGNHIRFMMLDSLAKEYGVAECIHKAPATAEDLRPILQGAAHYLYHRNRSHNASIENQVSIEFLRLNDNGPYHLRFLDPPIREPDGESLIQNGVISLDVAENDTNVYGIRITNTGKKDLYPNLFYFDNSELSIDCYFMSPGPSDYKVDSPLPADGKLNIGFGRSGDKAFEYYLPEGRNVDVGFLKCFLSTSPVDLSGIPQSNPFDLSRAVQKARVPDLSAGTWGCVTIPVIQKRSAE